MGAKILIYSPLEIFKAGLKELVKADLKAQSIEVVEGENSETKVSAAVFHFISHLDFLKTSNLFLTRDFPVILLCRYFNVQMLEKVSERENTVVFKENIGFSELIDALNLAISKGKISPDEVRFCLPHLVQKLINIETLTPREKEILYLLAKGMTSYSISLSLKISVHTVRNHLNRIYAKLDVSDRVSAVMKAISLGIFNDFFLPVGDAVEEIFDL